MKKLIAILLVVCTLTATIFAGGRKEATGNTGSDESLNKVKSKGVFVLGLDDSFPPLGFRDENNNIVGFDIDLAAEVCNRMGVKLECQPIDWAAKEMELNTDKIDCIWNGFTMTPERSEAMAFTKAYLNNAQVVIVRDDSGITKLSDLAGKKIGLQAGSSASDALDAAADFKSSLGEVVEYKDNMTALADLDVKGVDGIIMDLVVGQYSIKTTGKNFTVLDESLSPEQYGIGFKKGNNALRDEVQKTLEAMVADGTVAKISEKWFEKDISVIGK